MKLRDIEPQPAPPKRPGTAPAGASGSPLDARFEQLRALRAAWGVLASSTLSGGGHPVAEIGRLLGDHLNDLQRTAAESGETPSLESADSGLAEFARMLRTIAFQVPINELRALLPGRVSTDRRGVLDLLDLLLDFACEIDDPAEHVGAIDYVITLLSTGDRKQAGRRIRHDPVTLTPRLHALSERAAAEYAAESLVEIEAEFFAAANMERADVYAEMEQRTLRRRKMDLGLAFYAPGVLRAVVTYNATLLQRVTDEISESKDWGALPGDVTDAGEAGGEENPSVFQSPPLRALADAVHRRAAGEAPDSGAVDRVAWCLDLDYLDMAETEALLSAGVGQAENPRGTAILVGLVARSLVVLEDELVALGLSPNHLSGPWVRELDEALKAETNVLIASDSYDDACAIAGLKQKFLQSPTATPVRTPRPRAAQAAPPREQPEQPAEPENVLERARELAADAMERTQREDGPAATALGLPDWARGFAISAATLVVVVLGANAIHTRSVTNDLDRFSSRQLEVVSPYLTHGHRNGQGTGSAFVGFLNDGWNALDAPARTEAALDLVASLRAQGVREIMVYDDDGRLRLQLLGDQPLRLVQ